ncbi:ParB N-terminal domain-containing protein [Hoeflea sp. AS60]|uniref:ParB/RepB/Spo0J family partition protein n=1 Tax=Hoeflea sp. AS60 TaxID=3135780 RepID=UPI00317A22FC
MSNFDQDNSLIEKLAAISGNLRTHGTTYPGETPTTLDYPEISVEAAVFQPRQLEGRIAEDVAHLKTLAVAVGTPQRPTHLDPITVWWAGDRWYVIDGHHRLKAYKKVRVTQGLPVTVFEGTLDEAMAHSAASNSKDRLVMRTEDKLNYAWRLVIVSSLSKARIAKACAVSNGTLGNMRSAKAKLQLSPENTMGTLSELSWLDAQMEAAGKERDMDFDPDDAMRKRAERYRRGIIKAVGHKAFTDTDAFALALSQLDDRLPGCLMQSDAWDDSFRATVTSLSSEFAEAATLRQHWDIQEAAESDY